MSSSDTTEATVPATVTIPANQASATFTVTAVDDTLLDGTQTVTITAAAAGYVSGSAAVDVTDYETLTVIVRRRSIVGERRHGHRHGDPQQHGRRPPLTVTLASSDTSEATVPATVTIPANQASATFTVTAVDDTLLDGTQRRPITASAAGYVNGTWTLQRDRLRDADGEHDAAVDRRKRGRGDRDGDAQQHGQQCRPLTVTLSSSDMTEATVPATVTIPANQASATFTITAVDDTLLDGTQTVTITASATVT